MPQLKAHSVKCPFCEVDKVKNNDIMRDTGKMVYLSDLNRAWAKRYVCNYCGESFDEPAE